MQPNLTSGCLRIVRLKPWNHEYTQTLVEQGRLASCSHALSIEANVLHYAYINHNEEPISSNGSCSSNGAFLYLFKNNEKQSTQDYLYQLAHEPHGVPISSENQS